MIQFCVYLGLSGVVPIIMIFWFLQILTTLVENLSIPVTCKIRILPTVSVWFSSSVILYSLSLSHMEGVFESHAQEGEVS